MSDLISNSNLKALYTDNPSKHSPNQEKLVLVGREVKWLNEEDIKSKKAAGEVVIDSVDAIIRAIPKDLTFKGLKEEELANLLSTLNWLNEQPREDKRDYITKKFTDLQSWATGKKKQELKVNPQLIEEVAKQKKFLTEERAIKDISYYAKHFHEVTPDVANQLRGHLAFLKQVNAYPGYLCDIVDRSLKYFELPYEKRAEALLKVDTPNLLFYYEGRSFLKDNGLENLSAEEFQKNLTNKQKELFMRLFHLRHKETIEDLSKVTKDQLRTLVNNDPTLEQLIPIFQFSGKERTEALLKADEKTLLLYYKKTSFLEDQGLEDLSLDDFNKNITSEQKKLFMRLILLKEKKTLEDLQSNENLVSLLIKQVVMSPALLAEDSPFSRWFTTFRRLKDSALKDALQPAQIFQVAAFIEENRSLLEAGKIGNLSESRAHIRKIKTYQYHLPIGLDYNTKNGDIIVILKPLGQKSSFKVVKKQLSLLKLETEALAKQAIHNAQIARDSPKEIEIMKLCEGEEHLVQLHSVEVYTSQKKGREVHALTMHFYNRGDLESLLKELTLAERFTAAKHMIKGVLALHTKGILHRDLKSANIFGEKRTNNDGNEELHFVVGDLGFACFTQGDPRITEVSGTGHYMSPKLLQAKFFGYDELADYADDAWSVGVILSELFLFKKPTEKATDLRDALEYSLAMGDRTKNPEIKDKKSIKYVIQKLLETDEADRMKLDDALAILEEIS